MNGGTLEEMKRIEELKKIILKKILSRHAFERLGRIRLVKPALAAQLELYLVQLYQAGKLKTEISDEQLKLILESLTSKKGFRFVK
ncbi:MAG: DNA-binding protein [Candidatus Aenigmarchaeota archaeon]|nr:DNA-binding protein [Candidatus Aenigmarchaeota archaeon]